MKEMKEFLHWIYILALIALMSWYLLHENVCGVCFIGFLLINARLDEGREE